ncbi:hypothetical protein BDF22DRAFT_655990 [Syncephalis plumigaleata]|nr:hypothetical protein BDF22DRAFT_655990 [Syncephalis plumigaleata]
MLQRGMSAIARSNHVNTLQWTLEICKLMEEHGKPMGIGEFHILLAVYARQQQPQQAKKIITAMRQRGIPATPTAYNLWIGSHIEALDLFGALDAYESMQTNKVKSNSDTFRQLIAVAFGHLNPCNLIMDRFALYADTDGADYLFNYMVGTGITPSSFTYERLLDAHQQRGNVASVTRVYQSMREQGIPLTQNIGIRMIVFFSRLMNEKNALQVLDDMEREGVSPDVFGYTALIHLYAKLRDIDSAMRLFDRMKRVGIEPTRWTFNAIIRAYTDCGRHMQARQIINDMIGSGVKPNQYTYRPLMAYYASTGQLDRIEKLLEEMRAHDVCPGNVTLSAIIGTYIEANQMEDAHQFLDTAIKQGLEVRTQQNVEPDKASYDLLIRLFSRMADPVNATRILKERQASDSSATTQYTYVPLLAAYAAAGDTEGIDQAFRLMLESGTRPSAEAYNVLIHAHGLHSSITRALEIYRDMQLHHVEADEVTYTTLICRLADNGYVDEAERVFADAHQQLRTARAYNALISMYTQQHDLTEARRIYNELLSNGVVPDGLTYTLLMQAYVITGDAQSAHATMDELRSRGFSPDIVHYTTLLKAYALSHDASAAEYLRNEMDANNVRMDRIAWLWLFRALSYQYNMLWYAWDEMLNHNQASAQAFSVMVNQCASRANLLRRAYTEWERVRLHEFLDVRNYNQLAAALAKRRMLPEACNVLEAMHVDKPLDYSNEREFSNVWTWTARALVSGLFEYRQQQGDVKASDLLERLERVAPEILTLVEDEERIRREGPRETPRRRPDDPRGTRKRLGYREDGQCTITADQFVYMNMLLDSCLKLFK